MAFVRIKKVKGKEYGYLVENKWKKGKIRTAKGVKQKVKAYPGRVYVLQKTDEKEFWETINSEPESYLKMATKEKILHDLIRFELMRHGFVNQGEIWKKEDVQVDIKKKRVTGCSGAGCVLKLNEGHLYSQRIRKLYSYEANGEIEEVGPELAKLFIESGIGVPQEVFIAYYEKL